MDMSWIRTKRCVTFDDLARTAIHSFTGLTMLCCEIWTSYDKHWLVTHISFFSSFYLSWYNNHKKCHALIRKFRTTTSYGSVIVTVIWSWLGQHLWLILLNLPYNRWVWNIVWLDQFRICIFPQLFPAVFWQSFSFPNALAGSFSRSAVNHESGAKTGLSGLVMGIIMACALLFLTPVFEYIPQVKDIVWRCKVFTLLSVTRLLSTVTLFEMCFQSLIL